MSLITDTNKICIWHNLFTSIPRYESVYWAGYTFYLVITGTKYNQTRLFPISGSVKLKWRKFLPLRRKYCSSDGH